MRKNVKNMLLREKLLCAEIMRADANQDGKVTLGKFSFQSKHKKAKRNSLNRRMARFSSTFGN